MNGTVWSGSLSNTVSKVKVVVSHPGRGEGGGICSEGSTQG